MLLWNPITCDFECDKMCEISEYLDIKNCACKEIVIDNLVLVVYNRAIWDTLGRAQ